MKNHDLSHAGRRLLDRRNFLQLSGTGLGGIALATLLAESARWPTASNRSVRRSIRPGPMHLGSRILPRGQPRADGLLLRRLEPRRHVRLQERAGQRHDTPLPSGKLVTFQGENGNLIKPLWPFKPARPVRQNGLRVAAAPGRAGRRDVLYPFDDGQIQHARTGREPDEHRLHARRFPEHRLSG